MSQDTKQFFESWVITGLEVEKWGTVKQHKKLAIEGAKAVGVAPYRAKGAVAILDEGISRAIDKPVRQARQRMKEMTVPWSSSMNNDNGSRISGNEYLLAPEDVEKFRTNMEVHKNDWDIVLQDRLFSQWPFLLATAEDELGKDFFEHCDFPDLDTLRQQYSWHVKFDILTDVADVTRDIRLSAPQAVIDSAVASMKKQQANKFSNAVWHLANSVRKEANEIIYGDKGDGGIDGYVYNPGNNKIGNTLPRKPGWESLANTAKRLDKWTSTLDNENLTEASTMIKELVADIEDLGDGDLAKARSVLSGEDSTKRDEVREKLSNISNAVGESMTTKLDDFLG